MSQSPTSKKTPPLKPVNLDEIVSEIGELEQGMGMSKSTTADAGDEANLIRDLDELADDSTDSPKLSLLDDPAPVAGSAADGGETLSLTVRGGTQVALKFEVNGQLVSVSFKDGVLYVETADGAEFKIPLAA